MFTLAQHIKKQKNQLQMSVYTYVAYYRYISVWRLMSITTDEKDIMELYIYSLSPIYISQNVSHTMNTIYYLVLYWCFLMSYNKYLYIYFLYQQLYSTLTLIETIHICPRKAFKNLFYDILL